MDIKLPGLNTGNFHFHLPGGDIHITGKWFNYGIIFIVMILDLNMWKNQIFYEPFVYGQYTDDEHYIYTVSDRDFLANATKETLSYAWRWTNVNPLTNKTYGLEDHKMNSRYFGYPLSAKGTAFIPSLFAFTMFGILVKYFSKGGPPAKVAPMEEKGVSEDAAETQTSTNDVTGAREDSSSSPCVSISRQSLSSYKSEFALKKTKNFGSFLSMDSSRDGVNSSRDNFTSSRDNLNSSRDYADSSGDNLNSSRNNLESSRDDLRSFVDSFGVARQGDGEQPTTTRPAWSADTPVVALPPKKRTRRDSSATEKSTKPCEGSSNDEQNNENMVQELVHELSLLSIDEGERQSKESVSNVLSASNDSKRALSFGDLFRRDPHASLGSVATSDDEDGHLEAKSSVTSTRENFLQVPKAK